MTQPASSSSTRAPDLTRDLLARNFSARAGELLIGGVSIREIAGQFGTPLYVYDQGLLERSQRSLRETLPPSFDICYSVKANPNQALLRYFVQNGCGLEIASHGELVQALAAGCSPATILFAGPGKTQAEIDAAVAAGIGELHIESLSEARRVADAARRHNRRVSVAVRVNPSASIQGGGMRMGAKPAPFGIDEDQLDAALAELLREPALDVTGIHLYLGTQILDAQVLLAQYREFLEIARRAAARLGRPLRSIDFGGGWGVPYFAHETPLDLAAVRGGLAELAQEIAADASLREARLIVEPGRFLVAAAGIYVTQVVDVKQSRGKTFVVVDGGMHQHLAASGNLGQTIKRNFPVAALTRLDAAAQEPVDVVGPLCTPLDVLARSVLLPTVEPGDLIGILQSGAYARTASPLGFLSHPAPPEVLVRDGQSQLIRRRGNLADPLSDQQ